MWKNKPLMIALSALIAIVLWLYVVTVVSPESEATIYNIPVVLQGESILNERGLVLVSAETSRVNLQLYGNRTDLNKVNSGNITIIADLTKIYDPGTHNLSYSISYPGDVPSGAFTEMSRTPSRLKITVEQKITKKVPVTMIYTGKVSTNYRAKTDEAVLDYNEVSITGPASVIDQITQAQIEVDLSGQTKTFEQTARFTLCNEEGEPVDASSVVTDVAEVTVTIPIQFMKYVPLKVKLIPGGGADESNTTITYEHDKIRIAGSRETLLTITEIELGTIDLGTLTKKETKIYEIVLPEGVENVSLIPKTTVTVEFPDLLAKDFPVTQFVILNVPEGMTAEILNQTLTVKVRGPREKIAAMTPEDITVEVDFTSAVAGTSTVNVKVKVSDRFPEVGVIGTYSVNATLSDQLEAQKK